MNTKNGIFSVVADKEEVPWASACKKVSGGHVDIKYHLKEVYRYESTIAILPHKLVAEAIREELNDFKQSV